MSKQLPRVSVALRNTWFEQRAQLIEENSNAFDIEVLTQLLALPVGTEFDTRTNGTLLFGYYTDEINPNYTDCVQL